jgi:predicted ATPase
MSDPSEDGMSGLPGKDRIVLKHLYIDNYKCLVNFEFAPQRTQLILGANGAGKSTVFDVLWLLRQLITGENKAAQLFLSSSLTRWEQREEQTFELEVEGNGGTYRYKLVVQQKPETRQCRIASESLTFSSRPLLTFTNGEITIHREDHRVGAQFSFDWGQSAFVTLAERSDNRLHRWFRDWLGQMQVVRPNPFDMVAQTDQENVRLNANMTNFVSWYRHLIQETPDLIEQVRQSLAEIWEGFQGIRLEKAGPRVRVLTVALRSTSGAGKGDYEVGFGDLSDGQRVLIALYTLSRFAERTTLPLVCIDGPDNFVSLEEIQPWVVAMCQAVEDHNSQVLFISHHPELINYLAPQDAVVLRRPEGGPTRVAPFRTTPGSTLTPAEVIARGWDGE